MGAAAGARVEKLFVEACVGREDVACCCCCAGTGGGGAGSSAEAPVSSTDGSAGGGPSSAHLRDSYFERMNDSIFLGISMVST